MKQQRKSTTSLAAGLAALFLLTLAGANTLGAEAPDSGFIPAAVAGKMEEVKVDDKHKAKRWINTEMTGDKYKAIMIDPVIFYPAPDPSPQVSSSVLKQIADYLTDSLRRQIGAHLNVVDQAGPGVLRMQPAMTAVTVKKEGLSPLDVLPVHLAFSAAKAATGNTDETVTAMIEVRITDSVSRSDQAAVTVGIESSTQLENEKDQLTLKDFEYALDQSATRASNAIVKALGR